MKPSEKLIQHERVRPQLFINTEILSNKELESSLFEEIDKYSITPTTFKSRSLSENLVWYKDEYSHLANKVTRYGINPNVTKTDLENNTILGELTKLIDTTVKVEKSVKSSQYKLEDAQKITHHSLEKYLIQQAINQLLGSKDQTILVDIFARENGAIKILKDGIPETHTVVLYKNPVDVSGKHEVLVIDPSNFLFSSHLSNLNGIIKHELLSKVITIHKTLQIYKPDSENVGSDNNQYRDCIDIAVKLAFGFNKISGYYKDVKDIIFSDIVKFISNNSDMNKSIQDDMYSKQFVKIPLRIQQKSNIKIGEDFYKFSKTVKDNLTDIYKKEKLEKDYVKTLSESDKSHYIETLKDLYFISKNTFDQIHQELHEKQLEVLGKDFYPDVYDI